MTVRIEERGGKLVIDIRTRGPDGVPVRERRNAPDGVRSASGAKRWAEARQAVLAHAGKPVEVEPAPTLKDFSERWMTEYAHANRNKPSTIAAKETILRLHLLPVLGGVALSAIGDAELQRVKLHLGGKSDKTLLCVLSVLQTMLRSACRWNVVQRSPTFTMPRPQAPEANFYDFAEWERLIDGARRAGSQIWAAVLLAGDAGLRRGELVALEQGDVARGAVTVCRNEWNGKIGLPKGGKHRRIPLTARLAKAVEAIRHLRGKRLLWQANGTPVQVTTLQSWLEVACRRAGLPESRNLHKLRHTFCSHLAMNGVPMCAIQEWAGHADLKTTQRYMHLSPHGMDSMISVLERGARGEQDARKSSR